MAEPAEVSPGHSTGEAHVSRQRKGAGGFIDRHYIHYEIPVGHARLPILTAVGAGIVYAWTEYFEGATVMLLFGRNWGSFVGGFITVMFVTAVYPLVIRKYCKAEEPVQA